MLHVKIFFLFKVIYLCVEFICVCMGRACLFEKFLWNVLEDEIDWQNDFFEEIMRKLDATLN